MPTTTTGLARSASAVTLIVALALAGALADATDLEAAETNVEAGRAIYERQCARCHEIGPGAKHKVGPHLDQVLGRTAGSIEAFRYSKALVDAGAGGLVWNEETISAYIERPRTFVVGNRMSYNGMPSREERAAVIAWLTAQSDAAPSSDLATLASVSATAAPGFTEEILKIEGDREFGEYLAGDCVTCHQVSGRVEGLPSIVGIPRDYFVRALVEYKTNVRTNEVMKLRVQHLSNEDIAHLAAYFSSLEPK